MAQASPNVAIIGLDGADWSLLHRLFDEGVMPALKAFVASAASATLESVLPTNSMSAWASLMTGVNPGKHGVYDFVRPSGTPFAPLITNSSCIRYPTLCELLTNAGHSSCVIDMPPFYPPFAIDGVMLGGMGVVGEHGLSHPPEAAAVVREKAGGYIDDVLWMRYQGREDELARALNALTENRVRVAGAMLADRPFDLFCAVLVTSDRAQHAFWRDLTDDGPQRPTALGVYRKVDEAFARLLDRFDLTRTNVLVVSDHGFRAAGTMISVNDILTQAGLMRTRLLERLQTQAFVQAGRLLRGPLQKRVIDYQLRRRLGHVRSLPPDSRAYSERADTVNVNLVGRETTGSVAPEAYRDAVDAAVEALTSFRHVSLEKPPVRGVVRRDDYFHGPHVDEAPDLVIEFEGRCAYTSLVGAPVWEWRELQGVHRREGVIACAGPAFARGIDVPAPISILDVTPTVLSLFGLAPREDTDGRIADALLKEPPGRETLRAVPATSHEGSRAYSEEDEERVKERLRGLGYIE